MIAVHGLLGPVTADLVAAAATADHVVGGRRHLDALAVPDERRITLGALRTAVATVATLPPDDRVLVVASGDPLYFGVVRSLRAYGLRVDHVTTAPSSIATAFAAVGLPWDDAVVVSAHGRPLAATLNLARALPKVAVFTSAENGVREIAAGLEGVTRWYVLAERLGDPDQRVLVLDREAALACEPREPNVVLVLAAHPDADLAPWDGVVAGPRRPPRPDVSAPAALAYARLLPEPGELLLAQGSLGPEVAALAAWGGAAVVTAPVATPPDVVVADATWLPDRDFATPDGHHPPNRGGTDVLLYKNQDPPRAIVLVGLPDTHPTGYLWRTERIGDTTLTSGVRA